MSGSSLDGLDIAFAEFQESSGSWEYTVKAAECFSYSSEWVEKLAYAHSMKAVDYQLLHSAYGHYIGEQVNAFIEKYGLQYQVQLIVSHGHTTFHIPSEKMTAQLGDGAAIAATTGINVVSDLRSMDIALGGQGAPIVPIGEKLLLKEYDLFLNIGGIANLSYRGPEKYIAFDICPANRVLNMLSAKTGKLFDEGGRLAASGNIQPELLHILNTLEYYQLPFPKSLSNDFGTQVIFPMLKNAGYNIQDTLRTYVEHIAIQVSNSIHALKTNTATASKLLITGGGAHNQFLVERIGAMLQPIGIDLAVPDKQLVDFKEAIIMGLIGVLRWREENNVLASVTGAARDSIGGAVWIGQEA
jgi:anhydro-N-acetylmuramic acid kinase